MGGSPGAVFISHTGRFVLMECNSCGLAVNENQSFTDVLIRDRLLGTTDVVSVNISGQGSAFGLSMRGTLSKDEQFAAFVSYATDLVPNDVTTADQWSTFVRDLAAGQTELVNLSSHGVQGDENWDSAGLHSPALSEDGRFVAFVDSANTLVPNDTGGWAVFVRDRLMGTTKKVSVSSIGEQADDSSNSRVLSITANGRDVTFDSEAENLVSADANLWRDIFVHESCVCEVYCLVNANSTGQPARMTVQGSASVGTNDLVLSAYPLPDQFGLFYYGPDPVELPFGNGFRCVGGVVYRLQPAVQASGNLLQRVLDLTQMPPGGEILPGSTWNFQGWFRDPAAGGANFNLSDAASITFEL